MKTQILQAILVVLLAHATIANPVQTETARQFLSPPEIMEIVEKSDTMYQIVFPMEGLQEVNPANTIESLFPLSAQLIEFPCRITKEDGSHELTQFLFTDEMSTMFDEAESFFVNQQYPAAIRSYQKIIDRFPDCPIAYSHLGDSYFRTKQYNKAIEYFDRAIRINPFDHRAFVYKADSLMELGRTAEAKAAYIHALSLHPRYWLAMANLRHFADTLGIEVRSDLFQPKAFVRQEENGIGVYLADESSLKVWLPYALVKAIWLSEPTHREAHTGNSEYQWSSVEETEALLNLIMVYKSLKQAKHIESDSQLDLLERIVDAGDLPYFIGYVIASRINPHVTLTVSEDIRESLRQFIAQYVVVSTSPEKNPNGPRSAIASNAGHPADRTR